MEVCTEFDTEGTDADVMKIPPKSDVVSETTEANAVRDSPNSDVTSDRTEEATCAKLDISLLKSDWIWVSTRSESCTEGVDKEAIADVVKTPPKSDETSEITEDASCAKLDTALLKADWI